MTIKPTHALAKYARAIFFSFCLLLVQQLSAQKYVTVNGAGNMDGSTWNDAYDNAGFRTALQNAQTGDFFWIADGTYTPDNMRDSSFRVPNGVKLYGGFSATDTTWASRDFKKNETILSGDIGTQGVSTDNCYHVIYTASTDTSTVLDGFTISDGRANSNVNNRNHGAGFFNNGSGSGNSSSVTVNNCVFKNNAANSDGGGFTDFGSNDGYVASILTNCIFVGNTAANGGGLYAAGYGGSNTGTSYTTAINCVLVNNSVTSLGGGGHAHINQGQVRYINCTFAGNSGTGTGTAYYQYKGLVTLVNCLIHANPGVDLGKSLNNAILDVSNSIVQGGYAAGNNIINLSPQFSDSTNLSGSDGIWGTSDDGLQVTEGSPAVNNGLNDSFPSNVTSDILGDSRIKNNNIDLGAYESDLDCHVININTPYTTVCAGNLVTFTAAASASSSFTPAYSWFLNGSKTGANAATYTTGNLSDGDEIYCVLTNSYSCNYPNSPVSNYIYMHIQTAPSISLSGPACLGGDLTVTNAGAASTIVWMKGGTAFATSSRKPSGVVNTVAGDATGNSGADSTLLNTPVAVTVDDNGNMYIADALNNRIQKWAAGATYATTVAGDPAGASGADSNLLNQPTSVIIDQAGNMYIADAQNNRVQKWAPGATYGITVAGNKNGTSGTDSTSLNSPANLFLDMDGNLYITDNLNNRVQRWAPGATYGVTVAGDAAGTSGSSASLLDEPVGIYVDKDSNVYVSDNINNRVQMWAANATSGITIAGSAAGTAGNDSISFDGTGGIYMDVAGNLYISDINNNRVMKYEPGASYGIQVAGDIQGASGSGANELSNPTGIYVDGAGDVYVSDLGNNRIQKWEQSMADTIYTPTASGVYSAVVTTTAGCSITTNSINVSTSVTPSISITASTTSICAGTYITFTRSFTGGGTNPSYMWMKNGTSTGITDTVYTDNNWTNGDTVYCELTSNDPCATSSQVSSNRIGIVVNVPPVAVIGTNMSTTFCQGDSISLHATAGSSSYRWMLNGNTLVTNTDSILYVTAAGDYSVEVYNGACSDTSSSITINTLTAPTVTVTPATAQTFCQGDSVVLHATTSTNNTLQWFNAAGAISAATDTLLTVKSSGTYYAKVSNGTCTANSASVTVTVNALPTVSYAISGNNPFCDGDSLIINLTTSGGSTTQWYNGANSISGATGNQYIVKSSGVYTAQITANGCTVTSSAVTVNVNPLPAAPTITRAGQILTSSASASYQWYNNGTVISGATSQTYTFTAGGKYLVEITDANGCKNRSLVYDNTGLTAMDYTIAVSVVPNPNEGLFVIQLQGEVSQAQVRIYDIAGRLVISQAMNQTAEIDISNQAAGMYMVQVISKQGAAFIKVEKY